MTHTAAILDHALALGLDVAGVTPLSPPTHGARFVSWLDAGYGGEMHYLAARAAERLDPAHLAPGAASMILVAVNYNPAPGRPVAGPSAGRIARYAWGADYHELIKDRLYKLDAFICRQTGRSTRGKACVDTAPLLERDHAAQAGLGFIGRNCCLITPGLGSWTFLAALLVPEHLGMSVIAAAGVPDHSRVWTCGQCTRCLDACPTNAFVAPGVLDARRCIAYLTIELRGPVPRELRPLMGSWVFGCDVCQEVCPYNRAAPASTWPAFRGAASAGSPPLSQLLALDEAGFRAMYRGTALMRARRRGLLRNAAIAAGNAADPALIPPLIVLLSDPEPLVRGHAAWALGRIGGAAPAQALARAAAVEKDPWVRQEISAAQAEGQ